MNLKWEKRSGRNHEYIEITGSEMPQPYLQIPEQIAGLPVESIGKSAFYGRTDLKEVCLPRTVRALHPFCFYGCENLEKLSLYDSIMDYYDAVIRMCRKISEIEIFCGNSSFLVLKEMLADSDRLLNVMLHLPDGDALLTFPMYFEESREDTHARAIHFSIRGMGYAYRQCVTRSGISYREYDRLFEKAAQNRDDADSAVSVAFHRLQYPYELEHDAERRYEAYLKENVVRVLQDVIADNDTARMQLLMRRNLIGTEQLEDAIVIASGRQRTELCGMLMEYQRTHRTEKKSPAAFVL